MTKVYLQSVKEGEPLSPMAHALLERVLGFSPTFGYGPHGKPFLKEGPHFNLSHTKGLVVCAISQQPVGVDVELRDRRVRPGLLQRYFTPEEQAYATTPQRFLELWTRKEAFLKRSGEGLSGGLAQTEVLNVQELRTYFLKDAYILSVCSADPDIVLQWME